METKRAFTAIMLSLIILLGYQYLFPPPSPESPVLDQQDTMEQVAPVTPVSQEPVNPVVVNQTVQAAQELPKAPAPVGREIAIETSLFTAVVSESGGGIKSFQLKDYKESLQEGAPAKQLIYTERPTDLPLQFSWGNGLPLDAPIYKADRERVALNSGSEGVLKMTSSPGSGIEVERFMSFTDDSYVINLEFIVKNNSSQALQGAPYLRITNRPFSQELAKNSYLFNGPAVYLNGKLKEIKPKDLLDDGAETLSGKLSWVAYEDTYFLCGIIPQESDQNMVHFSASDKDKVASTLSGKQDIIMAGGEKKFVYAVYMGPRKLATLKTVGFDLDRIINFGWFDVLAKPALFLLNFFYEYVNNYGVAIILVTIMFKLLFWPISHKGMKSMKAMQKIQPKMAKLREKYKDDKDRLNQEMMGLYKTYKINPLGGCLPMVLQIPVFFALYKVLLQTIELRHAPFMLWMTDLSAPDRLSIGFDLPFLGGIPVLTLLMGASMFLQQKLTPTPADPTQAKIMMFLPVIFTFMFLNFASGLVLYWFINNLLSIGQQYAINRSTN